MHFMNNGILRRKIIMYTDTFAETRDHLEAHPSQMDDPEPLKEK